MITNDLYSIYAIILVTSLKLRENNKVAGGMTNLRHLMLWNTTPSIGVNVGMTRFSLEFSQPLKGMFYTH